MNAKACDICDQEDQRPLSVNVNSERTTLILCRQCAIGTVATLMSEFSPREVEQAVDLHLTLARTKSEKESLSARLQSSTEA